MTRRYPIADAKRQLTEILKRVAEGDRIELIRDGKPVAMIVPVDSENRRSASPASFRELYDAFLKRHNLAEHGIEDGYFDSLRDRST